jgi:hypothetical protein
VNTITKWPTYERSILGVSIELLPIDMNAYYVYDYKIPIKYHQLNGQVFYLVRSRTKYPREKYGEKCEKSLQPCLHRY